MFVCQMGLGCFHVLPATESVVGTGDAHASLTQCASPLSGRAKCRGLDSLHSRCL